MRTDALAQAHSCMEGVIAEVTASRDLDLDPRHRLRPLAVSAAVFAVCAANSSGLYYSNPGTSGVCLLFCVFG